MIFYTYDLEGNLIQIEADPVFNSIERSPLLTESPPELVGIMVAIPAKDGKPRLAMLPKSLFATGADMATVKTALFGKPDWFDLGSVTLNEKTTVARGNGVSSLELACPSALVGDRLLVTPVGKLPAGYMIGTSTCQAVGTIQIPIFHPAQDAETEFTIPCRVTAFRAPTAIP